MSVSIGLRAKFLLITSLLLIGIFSGITFLQVRDRTQELRSSLFEASKAFSTLATQPIGNTYALYKDSGTIKITQEINTFKALNDSITNISIVDISGRTVFSDSTLKASDISAEEASTFEPLYKTNENGSLETIVYPYFEASGARRFSIVYTVSDNEINSIVQREAMAIVNFGFVSLLTTLGLVYIFIHRLLLKPIEDLSRQATLISAGNLEQQITTKGNDEIASLGHSVNKMADSLKAHINELKEIDKVKSEFMMITSHNLRTPLAIIDGYIENMNTITQSPEQMKNTLSRISASVKRLEHFAEDILMISRFEMGNNKLLREKVNAGDFISRIVDEFAPTAELKKVKFNKDLAGLDTTLDISAPYIRSAIWNVLDNAVKFTEEGGTVGIKTRSDGKQFTITITDTGVGISNEELPKLFKKFHRGTSTLTYDYEGTGIGLYATKVMLEQHGGTIFVASEQGKGSTFTLTLPLASQ